MQISYPIDLPTLEQVIIPKPLIVKSNTLISSVITRMFQGMGSGLSLSEQDFSSELNLPSQAPSSCALVVENRQLLGIFTERDVVRLIASGMDLSKTEISQVMTQPVMTLTISETQNALTALSLMRQHRIRHLPVVDESGQLVGLVTESKLLQAIAPRQQLELELRHRERLFSTLVENSPDIIFRLDRHLRHIYINARVGQESGIPPEQFLGKTGRELGLPTEACDIFESACYEAFATGEITRVEYRIGDKYFLSRLIPERTSDGAIESLMGITEDITQRQQAEIQLQEMANALQLLYDHAPCGYHSIDKDGVFVRINDTELQMLGYTRDEVIGKMKFPDLLTAESLQTFQENFPLFKQRGWVQDLEFQIVRQDGSIFPASVSAIAIKDAAGNYLMSRSIMVDISERKRLEAERQQAEQNLAESEAQYRLLFENNPNPMWVFHPETLAFLAVNQAAIAHYGYCEAEFLDLTMADIFTAEDIPGFQATISEIFLTDDEFAYRGEWRHCKRDGAMIDVEITCHRIAWSGKSAYFVMVKDISDRKAAAAALQESEQKFRAIFNSTFQFMGLLTTEGIVVAANQTALDVIAAALADVMGKPFWETPWWTHFPQQQKQLQAAIVSAAGGEFVRFESKHIWADGTLAFVDFSLKPVFDEAGKVVMLIPEGRDISERQAALRERKLAEQKIAEQAALIDIATDAINVRDLNNRVIFWSQGAERLYGQTAAEAVGKKISELVYKDLSSEFEVAVNETLEKGAWQGELEKVSKTGKKIIVASRWTLVRDESGQPKSILVVSSDITEKKQLERQFYRTQRLESLGTLASGIAHDLNNVFTPILMISQLLPLKFNDIDRQTQELLNTLEDSTKRGVDLVKQILTFARGTEGKQIVLQVGHLLKEVAKIAQQTFPKSIKIRTEIPANSLWSVKTDPTQLHQVLINIVVNARDAMPNGGMLSIRAENRFIDQTYAGMNLDAHVGNYTVITIADTGIGIPPEIIDRIFDPFFTTKEVGKGTGLGLSTVLGIVKNHGGFLQVLSEVGKGTQFQVYLPAAAATATEVTTETELFRGNGELILIVDDESAVRQITTASLEEHNYKTLVAGDGIEAIALYATHSEEISVVLMDMMMPNMDGLTAIRTLRSLNPEVKIIASSGLSANRQQLMALGAKAFLLKPYTAQELLQTLSAAIATTTA